MKKVALLAITCLSLTACTFISPGSQQKSEPKKTTPEEKTTIVVNYTEPAKKPSKKVNEGKELSTKPSKQTKAQPSKITNNSNKPVKSNDGVSWNELLGHNVANSRFSLAKLIGYNFVDFSVNDDGSFTGAYVDRGTNFETQKLEFKRSNFKGRFEIGEQIDEYTYWLDLVELEVTSPTGEVEYIEDEANRNELTKSTYVSHTPGLSKDKSYQLVLKGSTNPTALQGVNRVYQDKASKTRNTVIMEASGSPVFYEVEDFYKEGELRAGEEDTYANESVAPVAGEDEELDTEEGVENTAENQDDLTDEEIFTELSKLNLDSNNFPSDQKFTRLYFNNDGTFKASSISTIHNDGYDAGLEEYAKSVGGVEAHHADFTGKFEITDKIGDGIYELKVSDLNITSTPGEMLSKIDIYVDFILEMDEDDEYILFAPGSFIDLEKYAGKDLILFSTIPLDGYEEGEIYDWTLYNKTKDVVFNTFEI